MSCIDDFLREGSRKQKRLLTPCHALNDPHDVGEETHVKHAIGFVQAEKLRRCKVNVASFCHVHHSTGRTDDDVDAFAEGLGLLLEVGATVDGQDGQPCFALEEVEFLGNLVGQFTRGCQDERLECTGWLASLEDGESKGSGFS